MCVTRTLKRVAGGEGGVRGGIEEKGTDAEVGGFGWRKLGEFQSLPKVGEMIRSRSVHGCRYIFSKSVLGERFEEERFLDEVNVVISGSCPATRSIIVNE